MIFYWQKIQEENPNTHVALQRITARIYEGASTSIQLSQLNEIGVGVEEAIKLGFLSRCEGKIIFSNLDVLREYLICHAVSLMEEAWFNVEELVKIHKRNERLHQKINVLSNLENEVLLTLAHEKGKNLSDCVVRASVLRNSEKSRHSFQGLYDSFWEILPQLQIEAEAIISVLDAMSIDFDRGSLAIYNAIEEISVREKGIAETLYTLLMSRASLPAAGLIFNILRAIARIDLSEAHQRALALSHRVEPILRRVGIRALGDFNYGENEAQKLLHSTLDRFGILRATSDPETDAILVMAYENLVDHTDEVKKIFTDLAIDSNFIVWKTTLSSLFRLARKVYTQEWYQQALIKLAKAQTFSFEELHTLDYCIEHYVKDQPEFSLQLIEAIAVRWHFENHEETEKLVEGLNQTFISLSNLQYQVLISFFTQWIASEEQNLHFLAFELNSYFNSIPVKVGDALEKSKSPTFVLSKQVLDALSEETTSYVLYRIAGYVIDASSLCALLLSALLKEPFSQATTNLVTKLLIVYVLYNYPGEAGKYLKDRADMEDLTETEAQVIQEALSQSQIYLKNRTKLPRLKEFQPSTQKTYLYRIAKWKHQQEMMEQAEEHSIFNKIMPSVLFLYGRATAREQEGQFIDPMPFISISASTEIPQGELIDPVGQAYLRMQWRYAGLSKTDNEAGAKSTQE